MYYVSEDSCISETGVVKKEKASCSSVSQPSTGESSAKDVGQVCSNLSSYSKPHTQSDQHNGQSHHKHHSSSHHRHRHHSHSHRNSEGHHHHKHADSSQSSKNGVSGNGKTASENTDGNDAPRELLVLSPTKIVIRDPVKSATRKKCVGHCGVQVNLKRRTDNKEVQTIKLPTEQVEQNTKNVIRTSVGRDLVVPADHQHGDHSHTRLSSESSSRAAKSSANRSTQTSSRWKGEKSKSSSQHSQGDMSHSSKSVLSDCRLLSEREPIPDCVRLARSPFRKYVHLEKYPNGGALVAHAYHSELQSLSKKERDEFADQFLELVYGETTEGVSHCVMGIVHDAASPMEDFIDYFSKKHPILTVKTGVLGKSDIETTTIEKYRESVLKNYCQGTFRWGPLMQISLVGTVHEEVRMNSLLILGQPSSIIEKVLQVSLMFGTKENFVPHYSEIHNFSFHRVFQLMIGIYC